MLSWFNEGSQLEGRHQLDVAHAYHTTRTPNFTVCDVLNRTHTVHTHSHTWRGVVRRTPDDKPWESNRFTGSEC